MKYLNEEIIKTTKDFAMLLSDTESQWNFIYEEIQKANAAQCDLLHEIENSERINIVNGYNFYKKLRDLRRYRRSLKNQQSLLEPLYRWVQSNKSVGVNLFKVKTSMENVKTSQDNWIYNSRLVENKTG